MNIALVCDFFYPRLGGVELHIYSLATCLRRLGHRVIIITHSYSCSKLTDDKNKDTNSLNSSRTGVRYHPGPIKVYYCPFTVLVDEDIYPTFIASFPLLRWIFLREKIKVVHSHQSTSVMGNEALVYASEMGIATVYTDHSLFGFNDLASLVLNKALKITLATVEAVICVSHVSRQNLILRTNINPSIVHIIPNAIDSWKFVPDPLKRSKERIKVVIISRLVYRKGVDLLVKVIPFICYKHPNVDFIIGGDGKKKILLKEMIEREKLHNRIDLLGSIPHEFVRDVLVQGHIFLNCSLTESFCIAILEAASCGLFVVSTDVGGISEVLPDDMIYLSVPKLSSLVNELSFVISEKIKNDNMTIFDPCVFHERIKFMYSWRKTVQNTLNVYEEVLNKPRLTLLQRIERYRSVGCFSGLIAWFYVMTLYYFLIIIEWLQPRDMIDIVPDLLEPIISNNYILSKS